MSNRRIWRMHNPHIAGALKLDDMDLADVVHANSVDFISVSLRAWQARSKTRRQTLGRIVGSAVPKKEIEHKVISQS